MAWSMPSKHRRRYDASRWDSPPPVTADRPVRIDARTAADLVQGLRAPGRADDRQD